MIQETLEAYGRAGVELLRGVIPKATGKTAASLRYEVYPNQLIIYARAFFQALETGRGPRKSSEYGGFDKSLEEWMKVKASETKTSKRGIVYYKLRGQWVTPKGLANKINRDGDKLFRSGGKDLYSKIVADFLEDLKKEVIKIKTKEYTDKVVGQIKEAV